MSFDGGGGGTYLHAPPPPPCSCAPRKQTERSLTHLQLTAFLTIEPFACLVIGDMLFKKVEPLHNVDLGTMKMVISEFSLYQGKNIRKYISAGSSKISLL